MLPIIRRGGISLPATPKAPVERPTTLYLNDREMLTVQTTPVDLRDWAIGYLCGEGVIAAPEQVRLVVDEERGLIWADTATDQPSPPSAGLRPVDPGAPVSEAQLLRWMQEMLAAAPLYQETGGMHVAMAIRLDSGERIIREDIGRHNAVDKALGRARLEGWPPEAVGVLTSGRISYEMCARLARFGAGLGASRTAATDQAYYLAMELGIDLVGYVRTPASLITYTTGTRILRRVTA
jgi:FdhD protein